MSKPKLQCYGWNAVRLSKCSMDHLKQLREHVEHEHRNPLDGKGGPTEGGQPTLYLFNKSGRKKLEAISWAMYYKHQQIAKATGGDV